jgi:hypothetical protein
MLLARHLLLALAFVCAGIAPGHAAVIIDVVLTPTEIIGDPPFGIGDLPAGPFAARFAIDEALPASFAGAFEVDLFKATIGDQTWDADDLRVIDSGGLVGEVVVHTDATGAVTRLIAVAVEGNNALIFSFGDRVAFEAAVGPCTDAAACAIGAATVSTRLVADVAEPAGTALLAAALAVLVAARRRQSNRIA